MIADINELKKCQKILEQKEKHEDEWYNLNNVLAYDWALFYVLIGARECGKSYAVMDYCLRQYKKTGAPFVWVRLTTISTQKMLQNKASKLVDADLVRKYDLELTTKGMDVFDHGRPLCKVLALSEMAKEKGVALFDCENDLPINIVCDEFQREPGEPVRFDALYNLTGTLENLCRSRKHNTKIFLICNLLEEANDILAEGFKFIPEEYGLYKLVRNKKQLQDYLKMCAEGRKKEADELYANVDFGKRAVIHYIAPSMKYLKRRKNAVANILQPEASNYTNEFSQDRSLLSKTPLTKPTGIIKFSKSKSDWFVIWDNNKIAPYNKENIKSLVIAMRPYIDEIFDPKARDQVFARYDARALYFTNLITQKRFEHQLSRVRQTR